MQSEKDVAISQSDLKPTASLSLERSYSDDLSSTIDRKRKRYLKATVSWPFLQVEKHNQKLTNNLI
jgi:outer membrane protein